MLSCGVHAAVFLLFSFVIVLDLGSAAPSVEITYVGRAGEDSRTADAVVKAVSIEGSPPINLPDRLFAEESIASSTGEEISLLPALAGKIDLVRDYGRSRPQVNMFDVSRPRVESAWAVSLAAKEEYTVEGGLAARRIIIRPPSPEYPGWAVKSGLEADMKLRVTVNPHGVVERVESVQSTGYPRMDLVASRYIKQWRFESRVLDTESQMGVVSVKFRLK